MKKYAKKLTITTIMLGIILFATLIGRSYYLGLFGSHPHFNQTVFTALPNWEHDDSTQAFYAFKQSCKALLKLEPNAAIHSIAAYGKAKDWQIICLAANKFNHSDRISSRKFFESWFEPYQVVNNFNANGLFTGYYLPLLHGHLKQNKAYYVPVYGLPHDLVKINLNSFRPTLGNITLVGQVKEHQLYPYPDRTAINQGILKKKATVLVWSNSPLDVFFAQIQGSAIVQLPHNKQIVIGYASGNGQPYTAIGKILVSNKVLKKEEVSMQSIRTWLLAHPNKIHEILNQNASYVFFRILKNQQPLGAQQIPVTPERSLAVDPHYIALGTPIWLNTTIPNPQLKQIPYQHLLIAQDTGGSIKGVIRGDIYWGAGEKAAFTAGHLASSGEYWVLLPKQKAI